MDEVNVFGVPHPVCVITGTGFAFKVIKTSSVETQPPLVIVQRSVYEFPETPEKLEVGLAAVVIVPPVPETILQAPVPVVGVFAAKVTLVKPQVNASVWFMPASETVTGALILTAPETVLVAAGVQVPETIQ